MTDADVAFLIVAHDNPRLLARLVDRLSGPGAAVFIHIDAKSDLKPFKTLLSYRPRVVFLDGDQRRPVHWGGYSMVSVQLRLLRSALRMVPSAERLILLSGVDYPLAKLSTIIEATRNDAEFVRVDRELNRDGVSLFDRRGHHLGLMDHNLVNPRTAPALLSRLLRKVEGHVPRRFPGPRIYYGSAWWALTRQAAKYIIAQENSPQARFFKWTALPEEQYFQTLIKASPFASRIVQDATRGDKIPRNLHALHYVRFIEGKPSPAIPVYSDLSDLLSSGALFTRKVHPETSLDLLDELDRLAR